MSLPRRILPGTTYLLTRRCAQRAFRLRPCDLTNQIFLYALALAVAKTGVVVHAVCVMSNHHHIVLTDVRGVLPDFLRELHRTVAKAVNASQGEWDNLWNGHPTNVVVLGDTDDVLRKIAYVVLNPVHAGLVATPAEWPGVLLWGEQRVTVKRPDDYFSPKGNAPPELTLDVCTPTTPQGAKTFRARLAAAITGDLSDAHRAVQAHGLAFLGRVAVLAKSFVATAKSYEKRRGPIPTVAAADPDVRLALLRAQRAFWWSYFAALRDWCAGVRDVVFPEGTWWMRVHHGAAAR